MEIFKRHITVNNGTAVVYKIGIFILHTNLRWKTKTACEHILFSRIDINGNLFKFLLINGKRYKVLRSRVDNRLLVDFKEMLDALLKLVDMDITYSKQECFL